VTKGRIAIAATTCAALSVLPVTTHASPEEPILVRTSTELLAELNQANAGRRIHLEHGKYTAERPIVVPDGIIVEGDGVMRVDADGLPAGFEPGTETIIEVVSGFDGNLLTLGDGAGIRGLLLSDLKDDPGTGARRTGNVVAVTSRRSQDVVTAGIVECEIDSPNRVGFTQTGPTGRGLIVLALNPESPGGAHEGASMTVRMERSIVATAIGGDAVFVNAFAARAKIHVTLSHNRLDGPLTTGGGTSRPDPVVNAEVSIDSEHNLYRSPRPGTGRGWRLFGASSPPHSPSTGAAGPSFNVLRVRSVADRIEGFTVAITAAAARRFLAMSGPLSGNRLELNLTNPILRSEGAGAADLLLYATVAEPDPKSGTEFTIGDHNTTRVQIEGASGSGPRANDYAAEGGPVQPRHYGVGNRIEFIGRASEFVRSNTALEPAPSADLFAGGR